MDVYFTESSVNVSGEQTIFDLTINISSGAEIPYFYGGQFVLEWNCSLFEIRNVYIANNALGHLPWYNVSNGGLLEWTHSLPTGCSLTGSNPQCLDENQGKSNFVVDFSNFYGIAAWGEGVNIPAGMEGTLVDKVRFRTYSGGDFKTGTTNISIVPYRKLCGFLAGSYDYDLDNITWTGTSVTVE